MTFLHMPLIIVVAFLLLTVVVGIFFSRKKINFSAYAVGSKDFSTATLVATVLATTFGGGGFVRTIEEVYTDGLAWIIVTLMFSSGLWVISTLSLRMGPFMQNLSMAETVGNVYGKHARIVTALVGICNSIIIVSGQIIVMTTAINMCIDIDNSYFVSILATLFLIFYSTFGGIRAVTFTDVLQFITFSILIPLLAWVVFVNAGKPIPAVVSCLQSYEKFHFYSLCSGDYIKLMRTALLMLSALVVYVDPATMQRVYMCASPGQSKKVFMYATIFSVCISVVIICISLFIFATKPNLTHIEIWPYLVSHLPNAFKGFVGIALLSMGMSTADSSLNACAVMMSHDVVKMLHKRPKISDLTKLKIAKLTTLVVGLLAMMLAFKCQNLLRLLYWSLDCTVPIITAPFILAIFGFRGTNRTVLIGMATGLLIILMWNKWVEPSTNINGSFIAMLMNALAMIVAHYFLKNPSVAGWVTPDETFKQIQQEDARKRAERREAIKNAWINKQVTFYKFIPSDATLRLTGIYMIVTAMLDYWFIGPERIYRAICQGVVGVFFTASKTFFSKEIPTWCISLGWLVGLTIYLPLNLLRHWWYAIDPIFSASLSLAHSAIILCVLPLHLGIAVVTITLVLASYAIATGFLFTELSWLFPLFLTTLFLFFIIIYLKVNIYILNKKVVYLKNQENIKTIQQLKSSLYDASLVPYSRRSKGYGFILHQVVRKVEESISFLDTHIPFYKQDLESILNKFYDWVLYFNKREQAKDHVLLQPTTITLDKLIHQVELALLQEVANPPKLLVEACNGANHRLSSQIVCDMHQIVHCLIRATLRVGSLTDLNFPIVTIKLHNTILRFKQSEAVDKNKPDFIEFEGIVFLITESTTPASALPTIKKVYVDTIETMASLEQHKLTPSIDLEHDTISSIIRAHYGYFEVFFDQQATTILLVLPKDVRDLLSKIIIELPLDSLTLEGAITPKEQADSMMTLMKFHDHICKSLCEEDPIDLKIISGLILLLRQRFRFKRHASGQLFYVRVVGIAELVIDWVFHSPKVIYAALLYELVRRTCLPLSYIEENYNLGVYAFVLNILKIDKQESLDHPSLIYVQNRLKKAIKEDHIQLSVLFIKLAERLYDLRHAAGYVHLTEVRHMAQETLAIDIHIANKYLDPEIGQALETAAKEALEICKHKEAARENHKKKHSNTDH